MCVCWGFVGLLGWRAAGWAPRGPLGSWGSRPFRFTIERPQPFLKTASGASWAAFAAHKTKQTQQHAALSSVRFVPEATALYTNTPA
eukprot:3088073-Pyramimonas_sp.AAC.1